MKKVLNVLFKVLETIICVPLGIVGVICSIPLGLLIMLVTIPMIIIEDIWGLENKFYPEDED